MVSNKEVENQLKKLGVSFRYWGRNEIKELRRVLTEGETIKQCVNGHYEGGFAMLVATDQRLLLIDRKPMYLTIEAIWYDKIGQIDFYHRLLNAQICISTPNKELKFTTWNNASLHDLLTYSQEKMAEAKIEEIHGASVTEQRDKVLVQPEAVTSSAGLEPYISGSTQLDEPQSQATTGAESFSDLQPHMDLPKMPDSPSDYDLTLYRATRLPFSRQRYFARN